MSEEFKNQLYYLVGFLIITNLGSILKIYNDKKKELGDEVDKRVANEVKEAVQFKEIQGQVNTLLMTMGEFKESMRDMRQDLNAAFIKLREKNNKGE